MEQRMCLTSSNERQPALARQLDLGCAVGNPSQIIATGHNLQPGIGGAKNSLTRHTPVNKVLWDSRFSAEIVNVCVTIKRPVSWNVARLSGKGPSGHFSADRLKDGPFALTPCGREEDCFTTHWVVLVLWTGPGSEAKSPPIAVSVREEVTVANSLKVLIGATIC
jgi:hypothetical protein